MQDSTSHGLFPSSHASSSYPAFRHLRARFLADISAYDPRMLVLLDDIVGTHCASMDTVCVVFQSVTIVY